MLDKVKIVLSHPFHPGNIGSSARAMKNMGLKNLRLVNPKNFPSEEADTLAKSATDILENAKVFSNLDNAIADCHFVFGTSGRTNKVTWPILSLKQAMEKFHEIFHGDVNAKIAVLFGTENSGLSNNEIRKCDYQVFIPTAIEYPSINLSQAVQIICYELWNNFGNISVDKFNKAIDYADKETLSLLYDEFEKLAIDVELINPVKPSRIPTHLRKILTKAQLEGPETRVLFGLLKHIRSNLK